MRPGDYTDLPENRHGVQAAAILFPTGKPITPTGISSKDFVEEQGGDKGTLIFIFGLRQARGPSDDLVEFVEGVFLSESGPGFHPTWDLEQLLREIDAGGWKVVPREEVLERWVKVVEERMNKGDP